MIDQIGKDDEQAARPDPPAPVPIEAADPPPTGEAGGSTVTAVVVADTLGETTTGSVAAIAAATGHPLRLHVLVGVVLFTAYIVQMWFELDWIAALQRGDTYKFASGTVLALYLGHQWLLTVVRVDKRVKAARAAYRWHQYAGALAPLVFFAHAARFGYAYLAVLGTVFFANVALGLIHPRSSPPWVKHRLVSALWMPTHVALAVVTVGLTIYHVGVALYYE